MPLLSASRTSLDSFLYWTTFLFLAGAVTFFLNSMIELANAEEHQYQVSSAVDASMMSRVRSSRSVNSNPDPVPYYDEEPLP